MKYKEIKGDIISLAKSGKYNVVVHGVNCFSAQYNGLAPQMVKAFGTNTFTLELPSVIGQIAKLGNIESSLIYTIKSFPNTWTDYPTNHPRETSITVINAYTQFNPGPDADIHALRICLKKINNIFKGKKILLPKLCAGIGGLLWTNVKKAIKEELKDCNVTIVIYEKDGNKLHKRKVKKV